MIGLDTNILVRYVVRDDPVAAAQADQIMEQRCTVDSPGYINFIVLCEIVWVLRRGYRYDRDAIAQVVAAMLTARTLRLQEPDMVMAALEEYREKRVDLPDAMIALWNRRAGCRATLTFDRDAGRAAGFEPVPTGSPDLTN